MHDRVTFLRLFILFLVCIILLTSCGSVFKGMRSSTTGDIKKSPYYVGKISPIKERAGYFPVTLDSRLQGAFMGMERRLLLIPLVEAMNNFLDSLGLAIKLEAINLPIREAPDVYVGNQYALTSPVHHNGTDDKDEKNQKMVIYRLNPSAKWKEQLSNMMINHDVDYALFITVGFSEFLIRHRSFLGKKIVDMGTGYEIPVPWLSDMETPAEVFYVSGILLHRNGKIIRAGTEGIVAKKTGFFTSMFDMQELLSKDEIKRILQDERREDLPGIPLKWQVALQNLVAQLFNRIELIVR